MGGSRKAPRCGPQAGLHYVFPDRDLDQQTEVAVGEDVVEGGGAARLVHGEGEVLLGIRKNAVGSAAESGVGMDSVGGLKTDLRSLKKVSPETICSGGGL